VRLHILFPLHKDITTVLKKGGKLVRTFRTEVVLTITTGKLLCEFADMHECCEYLANSPIFTHQFANRPLMDAITNGILAQHPQLKDVDVSGIIAGDFAGIETFLGEQRVKFGGVLNLHPINLTGGFNDRT
jgi:hypothetical protein